MPHWRDEAVTVWVLAAPCRTCGCGSMCHWEDLRMPTSEDPKEWAKEAAGAECQRCPKCKGGYVESSVKLD